MKHISDLRSGQRVTRRASTGHVDNIMLDARHPSGHWELYEHVPDPEGNLDVKTWLETDEALAKGYLAVTTNGTSTTVEGIFT